MRLITHQEKLQTLTPEQEACSYNRPDRRRAVIIFTPRSGSSWLSELLASTRVFGIPFEHAAHGLLDQSTFSARTETDYLNAFEQYASTENDVFSIEITWGDIERFETIDFFDYYKEATFYHLRRRDILAQAVSLHLATSTGLFHKTGAGEIRVRPEINSDLTPSIKRWCGHILNYEMMIESQMLCRGIEPMRLIYEDMVQAPLTTAKNILAHHGIDFSGTPTSSHMRLVSEQKDTLCREFRQSEPRFLSRLEQLRPPI